MISTRRTIIAALILCLGGAPLAAEGNREAMADAMARMMEAMGFLSSSAQSMTGTGVPGLPAMPGTLGVPGMGMPGMGVPGMPGGALPFTDPTQMDQAGRMGGAMMERFSQPMADAMGTGPATMPWMPGSGGALEGVWEAVGSGLLIVQGGAYRLYSGSWAYVDGSLRIEGERLRLTNPEAGFDLEFDFALDPSGRLVLRDPQGQIYLYRRLALGSGGGGGDSGAD